MRSMIFWGDVSHIRRVPERHGFGYPLFTFGIDLDELADPLFGGRLLSYNRASVLTIRERDYLEDRAGGIREKLEHWLREKHGIEAPARVMLLTMPRLLGYIFNPVSFYIGRNEDGSLHSVVTEVNNTFGEKHLYLLTPEQPGAQPPCIFHFKKEFFVSPFFPVDGDYRLTLARCDSDFEITVDLIRGGDAVFSATLRGRGVELSRSRILATMLRFPFTALVTMLRIYKEAFRLYFWRSATIYRKPCPQSGATVRSRLQAVHRLRLAVLGLGKRRDDSRPAKR